MKALRCQTDGCPGAHLPTELRNQGYIALRGGQPYLIGTCLHFPLVAKCARCKRPSTFRAVDFHRLPDLSVDQLREFGVLEAIAKDWTGSGLEPSQAHDLIAAGLMGPGAVEHR